ncbi:hypothetical protein [Pseudonocardia spirodelae]|uniref:Uncharacterized protein n=1 Tax=Pseudonocardia spirodelae TaxID=3133431 RepID=A0ABU8T868_9PSEU
MSDHEREIPLDPERAVDELEERVLGRRTDAGGADDDGHDPVDGAGPGDPGTGVDGEPSG